MDATVVATRNVNVRAAPNTVGDPLGVVAQGTEVAVVGKVIGADWYQIERPDGGQAYVYAPLFVSPECERQPPTSPRLRRQQRRLRRLQVVGVGLADEICGSRRRRRAPRRWPRP